MLVYYFFSIGVSFGALVYYFSSIAVSFNGGRGGGGLISLEIEDNFEIHQQNYYAAFQEAWMALKTSNKWGFEPVGFVSATRRCFGIPEKSY